MDVPLDSQQVGNLSFREDNLGTFWSLIFLGILGMSGMASNHGALRTRLFESVVSMHGVAGSGAKG